jgi:2-isopropylmalate synthase
MLQNDLVSDMNVGAVHGIKIIDCTLREGMQAPGVKFSLEESVNIAFHLVDAGVDLIECGHPAISEQECARVRAVCAVAGDIPVLSHARATIVDVEAVARAGATQVGIFLGVNKISRESRVRKSMPELIALVESSVSLAKRLGLQVRFTVEDSSRTEPAELAQMFRFALDAGADRICFADTVGAMTPQHVSKAIGTAKRILPGAVLEGHFHDDRGFALANAYAAAASGCQWISTSTNGLGERCGITDTIQLIVNEAYEGRRSFPKPGSLDRLSQLVALYSRIPISTYRPMVGRHAFHHTAKLHQTALDRNASSYEWVNPSFLGRSHSKAGAPADGEVE